MIDLTPLFGSADAGCSQLLSFRVFPRKGAERWMLEKIERRPWHLRTWPRANLRARTIYRTAEILGAAGLHLPSRMEQYAVGSSSVYAQLRGEFSHLGIFLGTPGPNRKIVVFAERPGRSVFVKIPLGKASIKLVANEAAALSKLSADPDLSPLLPYVGTAAGHLAVENVEAAGVRHAKLDFSEVLRVNHLLESRSDVELSISELRHDWEQVSLGRSADHGIETTHIIDSARNAASAFLDALEQESLVRCYMAHGDFTRWNVLRAEDGSARIIDWELYGLKPRYFDLLHYYISSDLLLKRRSAESLLERVSGLWGHQPVPEDWQKYVGLYLSFQATYYSKVYESQTDLHSQALWQLKTWTDMLRNLDAAH